jgi:V/A-type H+-transporting ATPase subunit I
MFKLFTILSASCVVWGVLTASYFGIDLSPKNALTKVSIFNYLAEKKADYHFKAHDEVYNFWIKDYPDLVSLTEPKEILQKAVSVKDSIVSYDMLDEFKENLLLEFSLLIGVIHISFSFLRYLWRNWAGLGWIGFMFGGYLYFPSMLKATSIFHILGFYDKLSGEIVGLQLLYGGIGLAVVLALIQKRLKGFGEIAHVVQVFADVLSYLRLYALALAGSIMASTFNDLGIVVGYLFGGVVILFGHSVNILLGTMAGVIHGLRLNFIEWYHYSFEGGGRLFKPLKRLKIK